jgi:hypothetical protein
MVGVRIRVKVRVRARVRRRQHDLESRAGSWHQNWPKIRVRVKV